MITTYDGKLSYGLKTPCDDCPFRRESTHPYSTNAVTEWLTQMINKVNVGHSCHKTDARADCESAQTYTGPLQHCAGAIIMLRKSRYVMMPEYLCDALFGGDWDFRQMDMAANVYDFRELVEKIVNTHGIPKEAEKE
jgi:hypothetical protein